MLAEIFDCTKDNISLHLKNIFNNEELDKKSVVEDFSLTARDGENGDGYLLMGCSKRDNFTKSRILL